MKGKWSHPSVGRGFGVKNYDHVPSRRQNVGMRTLVKTTPRMPGILEKEFLQGLSAYENLHHPKSKCHHLSGT